MITYHGQTIENKIAYVNRPRYLDSAVENPRKYWKFAITNVLNMLKRK
jgi:hypothetical protein